MVIKVVMAVATVTGMVVGGAVRQVLARMVVVLRVELVALVYK